MKPRGRSPLARLYRLLTEAPINRVTTELCAHYQSELPLFVTDELAGLDMDEMYPDMAHHLDICVACLYEYAELAELSADALLGKEFV